MLLTVVIMDHVMEVEAQGELVQRVQVLAQEKVETVVPEVMVVQKVVITVEMVVLVLLVVAEQLETVVLAVVADEVNVMGTMVEMQQQLQLL